MGIKNWIDKNEKLHYIFKAFKHLNDSEYRKFFLEREYNPLLLEAHSNGAKFKDQKFYYIRENGNGYGFFAEFHALLDKFKFAEMFGMTPIVYWGDSFLYIENHSVQGTNNGYQYYFDQPTPYKIEDLDNAYFVMNAKNTQAPWIEKTFDKGEDISEQYELIMAEMYRKYIHLNDQVDKQISKDIETLLEDRRTLGVHFRGTDFKENYNSHPVNVKMEQEFNVIDELLEKENYDQIFLATDDKTAIEEFVNKYGNKIRSYQDVFRGTTNVSVAFSHAERQNHHFLLGYEVLRDMLTLSNCDGLVAGISQVSICARIAKKARNEQYHSVVIIDNGKNHNDKIFSPKDIRN